MQIPAFGMRWLITGPVVKLGIELRQSFAERSNGSNRIEQEQAGRSICGCTQVAVSLPSTRLHNNTYVLNKDEAWNAAVRVHWLMCTGWLSKDGTCNAAVRVHWGMCTGWLSKDKTCNAAVRVHWLMCTG
eukprot:8641625-Alexandrium_andersonii.AAC.1